jgi:two-component system, OmpR family, phosphate regulon sensor histidine kinase PhoR
MASPSPHEPESDTPQIPQRMALRMTAAAVCASLMLLLLGDLVFEQRAGATLLLLGAVLAGAAFFWLRPPPPPAAPPPPPPPEPPKPQLEDLAPLVDALPEAALLVDRDGKVIASNAEVRRQLAFNATGLRLSAVLRQPEVLEAVEAAAVDGVTGTVEYETASQFAEHFRVYVSPVLWGGSSAALAIFNDRTAMIASERMRADFLANASHELKTPVASLSLLVETLAGPARDDAEAQNRFFAMMRVEIDRMRRLIEDLLSLSKIELNEHVPPAGVADLDMVAQEVVGLLEPMAQAKGIALKVGGSKGVAVVGDRFQLSQVAKNLIENAIKYTPAGKSVSVEVGTAEGREAAIAVSGRRWRQAAQVALLTPPPRGVGRYAYLRVADEGGGIPRRHLPRLGERFYRVERPDGQEKTGTGLGLAIVKHIVNRHRGGLLVESEAGVGSAFAAYFACAAKPGQTGAL